MASSQRTDLTRRQLLAGVALGSTALSLVGCRGTDTTTVVGKPGDFRPGPTFVLEARVFIIRRGQRFQALDAICTHQNCTVTAVRQGEAFYFQCPCHAGQYAADGTPIAGPPPLRLATYALSLTGGGELVVDRSRTVPGTEWLEV